MNKLRYNKTRLMMTLVAIPAISLFTAGNGYAFTDMNDSAAQADVVKTLQKRIDSLEVRFEKEQLSRNEAKKTALDWNRGVFAGGTIGMSGMPDFFTGYMFNIKRKNGTHFMLSPLLRVGYAEHYYSFGSTYAARSNLTLTLGLQKTVPLIDRVSYSVSAFVHAVQDESSIDLRAHAFGGGVGSSLNLWFTEKSTIGLGFAVHSYYTKPDNLSWTQAVQKSEYTPSIAGKLHFIYTQHFLKHRGTFRK